MIIKGWIELLSLIIGILGAAFGILGWWKASIEKSYAAERDFKTLQRNQEEIKQAFRENLKEMDRRFDYLDKEALELKNWLQTLSIAVRGDNISSGVKRDSN